MAGYIGPPRRLAAALDGLLWGKPAVIFIDLWGKRDGPKFMLRLLFQNLFWRLNRKTRDSRRERPLEARMSNIRPNHREFYNRISMNYVNMLLNYKLRKQYPDALLRFVRIILNDN